METFLRELFSDHQLKIFQDFEQWNSEHVHVVHEDDWDKIVKYYDDYGAWRGQVLRGFVADALRDFTNNELKMLQVKIHLQLLHRAENGE